MWCLEGARCCCREPKNVAHARPAPLHRYIINLFKKLVSLDLFCRKGMTMEEIIKHFTGKCFYNKTNCLRDYQVPEQALAQKSIQLLLSWGHVSLMFSRQAGQLKWFKEPCNKSIICRAVVECMADYHEIPTWNQEFFYIIHKSPCHY